MADNQNLFLRVHLVKPGSDGLVEVLEDSVLHDPVILSEGEVRSFLNWKVSILLIESRVQPGGLFDLRGAESIGILNPLLHLGLGVLLTGGNSLSDSKMPLIELPGLLNLDLAL